jgi:hypothetical protein
LSQLSNDTNFITTSSNITGTSANVTGTVALTNGGTGATTAVNALNSLSAYGLQSSSVASGVDLNTLVTTGFYFQTNNVNTSFATNYPELSAGILQVYAQPNFTYQYYHIYNSTVVYVRSKYSAGAWTSWDKKITSGNIGTYAPSLSGTGATGVWGIGISGNAATATKLATAVTINGTSFDGSTSISVSDSNKLPLSGGTLGGSLTLDSAATLRLKANSGGVVGDITFFNFDGSERHRIWDGTTGLNYRNAGGTTYTLIHSGNIGSYSSSSANPSFTGTTTVARLFAQSYVEKKSTITAATASATITLDTANYNNFQLNLNATPVTLNFGTPGSGTDTYGFTLKVINGAAGQSLVFPPNGTVLKWPNGQMPTRTTTNGAIDWWYFWTDDNGVTWNASLNSQDSK